MSSVTGGENQGDLLVEFAAALAGCENPEDTSSDEFQLAKNKAEEFLESSVNAEAVCCEVSHVESPADGFELINAFAFPVLNADSWEDCSPQDFANTRRIAAQLANFTGTHLLSVGPFASQGRDSKNNRADTSKLRMRLLAQAMRVLLPGKSGLAGIKDSRQIAIHLDQGYQWAFEIERGLAEGKDLIAIVKMIQASIDEAEYEAGIPPTDISIAAIKQRAEHYRKHARAVLKKYS